MEPATPLPEQAGTPSPAGSPVRKNLIWLLNGNVFQLLLTFLVAIAVARYLGPAQYGVLGVAIAFAGLFTPLGLIGGELVIRDLSADADRHGPVLGNAAAVGGAAGCATFSVAVLAALVFLRSNPTLLAATIVMSTPLLLSPVRTIEIWFKATLQGRYVTLATGAAALVSAGLRIGLIFGHAGVVAFALVLAGEQFLGAILTFAYYRRDRSRPPRWSFNRQRAVAFARQALPLLVAGFAIAIYMEVDQVMLGALSSARQTGIYAAVSGISEASYFIPVAIAASFAPAVARARTEGTELYQGHVDRLLGVLAATGMAVAIPMALVAVPVTVLLLGPHYRGAGPVLAVHALSAVFIYLGVGASVWLTNERLQVIYMWHTLSGAVLNVALNLVLIPWLGALGAAISTLIAYAFASVFSNALNRRTRPVLRSQLRALRPLPMVRLGLAEAGGILRWRRP